MRGKVLHPLYLIFSSWLVLLSLGLVNSAVGNHLSMIAVILALFVSALLVAGGAFTFPSKGFISVMLISSSLALFIAVRILAITKVNLCYASDQIVLIEGRTVYDSSLTTNGNHMMKIMLTGCKTLRGDFGSASGLVTVFGNRKEIISFGTVVRFQGHFSDSVFVYDQIQVMGRSRINAIREYLISRLEYRMAFSESDSSTLSTLLLFGRSDYAPNPIRELAQNCGCSHVLALSGMHLGILASISKRLFGNRWLGKTASAITVALFVFLAGPRPSLVRAALSFALGFLDIRFRLFAVFLIQMILFPASMTELGCCYGYAAVFAIVFLSPIVKAVLFQLFGKASELFSATISVMVFSAPIQMVFTGKWHMSAIIASPIAAFLAACSMVLGLLILSFGQIHCLVWLNDKVYAALKKLFEYFGSWQASGWVRYVVFLSVVILLALLTVIVQSVARRRSIAI